MRTDTTYDIHLASDTMPPELEKKLNALGFARDNFLSGTEGVIRSHHLSKHPANRDLFVQSWEEVTDLLASTTPIEFCGYVEAEVVAPKHYTPIAWKPFDSTISFPFGRLEHEPCPLDKHKDFDVHITADMASIDPALKHLFEDEINFYYVDVGKASGQTVRVYTVQPVGVKESPKLYDLVVAYLQAAGGLEGKVKLEATYSYARFPRTAAVPPIITKMPPLSTPI